VSPYRIVDLTGVGVGLLLLDVVLTASLVRWWRRRRRRRLAVVYSQRRPVPLPARDAPTCFPDCSSWTPPEE
jgi:hypothetical protein